MDVQIIHVDVTVRAAERVQIRVTRNVDHELVPLPVIVSVVAVVRVESVVLVTVWILLYKSREGQAQFQPNRAYGLDEFERESSVAAQYSRPSLIGVVVRNFFMVLIHGSRARHQ